MTDSCPIPGVRVKALSRHEDQRGHLVELFRSDDLPDGLNPVMGYLSVTLPGVVRGPHEHEHQTDCFAFIDGSYELYLWDARDGGDASLVVLTVGQAAPVLATVPPGVVHAYKNTGANPAFVLNFPDRLYGGKGRKGPVDEIRHENDPDSRYQVP